MAGAIMGEANTAALMAVADTAALPDGARRRRRQIPSSVANAARSTRPARASASNAVKASRRHSARAAELRWPMMPNSALSAGEAVHEDARSTHAPLCTFRRVRGLLRGLPTVTTWRCDCATSPSIAP